MRRKTAGKLSLLALIPSIMAGVSLAAEEKASIDANAVEAALLRQREEFRLCYEKQLNADNPALQGRVVTVFTVGSDGRATKAEIQSTTLKNAETESCILKVIRRIDTFPKPTHGSSAEVTYPFKFSPLKK